MTRGCQGCLLHSERAPTTI